MRELRVRLTHPAQPQLDPQEVKAISGLPHPGLLRVEFEPEPAQPLPHVMPYPRGVDRGRQQNHQVITLSDPATRKLGLLPHLVKSMQVHVRQKGRNSPALRRACVLGFDIATVLPNTRLEPSTDEFQ
jgi:hypothetical protein